MMRLMLAYILLEVTVIIVLKDSKQKSKNKLGLEKKSKTMNKCSKTWNSKYQILKGLTPPQAVNQDITSLLKINTIKLSNLKTNSTINNTLTTSRCKTKDIMETKTSS